MLLTPPYRIVTERCVLRSWEPADAPALHEAIASSIEHLRAWLPWASREPLSTEERVQYLRRSRAQFDRDEDYAYGIFASEDGRVIGGTGLLKRLGATALELGYWIRSDRLRQGYAAEATAALTHVGLTLCRAERVEIHCNPLNLASQALPRKLGYRLDGTLRRRARTPTGAERDTMIWSLFADELSGTPSADSTYRAFDACAVTVP